MANKKRNKKYNKFKQGVRACNFILRDCAVIWTLDMGSCRMIDTRKNKEISVGAHMAASLTEIRHNWCVHLICILNIQDKLTLKARKTGQRDCFQYEIADALNDKHLRFAKEQNKNHLCSLAWIATPYDTDFADEHMMDMLEIIEANHTLDQQAQELKALMHQ